MAELKQESFGVNTQFQSITPVKKVDNSAERIKIIGDAAISVAGQAAKSDAKEQAAEFAGVGESARDRKASVDLFEQDLQDRLNSAGEEVEGPISEEEMGFLRDEALRDANLTARRQ